MSWTDQSWVPLAAEMRSILIISIFSCFFAASNAKIFSKCELARKLKAQGMDGFHGYSLANCEYEPSSSFLSLPKDALFPNPEVSPFLVNDFLSCQGSLTPRPALLVSDASAL